MISTYEISTTTSTQQKWVNCWSDSTFAFSLLLSLLSKSVSLHKGDKIPVKRWPQKVCGNVLAIYKLILLSNQLLQQLGRKNSSNHNFCDVNPKRISVSGNTDKALIPLLLRPCSSLHLLLPHSLGLLTACVSLSSCLPGSLGAVPRWCFVAFGCDFQCKHYMFWWKWLKGNEKNNKYFLIITICDVVL